MRTFRILFAIACLSGCAKEKAPEPSAKGAESKPAAEQPKAEDAEMSEDAYFESAADHDGLQPRQYLIEPRYPDIVPRSFQPRYPPTRSLHSPIGYGYVQPLEQDV